MPNRNYAFTKPLLATFRDLGLEHLAISPGSRNTPLAIAAAETDGLAVSVHLDERSAAFFGLGMAKATGRAVALISTSGTAAAEYLPAIIEARLSHVPLLILTADRPQEMRDIGAPQTVRQTDLYGSAVKWSHDSAPPDPQADSANYSRRLATQAWAVSQETPPGPVHLNLAFRDPLAPVPTEEASSGTAGSAPIVHLGVPVATDGALLAVASQLRGSKTLIVAGPSSEPESAPAIAELAAALNAPVFADPLSGLRTGQHPMERVISTGDAIARAGHLDDALRPDVVLRFGPVPTSKALWTWLEATDVPQVWVDVGTWREATSSASVIIRADAADTARRLADLVNPHDDAWVVAWAEADQSLLERWESMPWPSEPAVAAAVGFGIVDGAGLVISSSMPIRDIDAFFGLQERPMRLFANRAANGIDGVLSTALGVAATGRPTYVLIGDVAFLHDATALASAQRLGLALTVILINNDGGGIFHFLPQADYPDHFERLLATPHGTDLRAMAEGMGATVVEAGDLDHFLAELGPPEGVKVIIANTNRTENRRLHGELFDEA